MLVSLNDMHIACTYAPLRSYTHMDPHTHNISTHTHTHKLHTYLHPHCLQAGANMIVSGSAVITSDNPREVMNGMKEVGRRWFPCTTDQTAS